MTDRKPWAGSTGRQRTRTAQWRKVRAEVLDRDAHRCVLCGAPANEVDHVTPHADGGTDQPDNLRSLCPPHHAAKTAADAAAARARLAAVAKRQAEVHPGLRRHS